MPQDFASSRSPLHFEMCFSFALPSQRIRHCGCDLLAGKAACSELIRETLLALKSLLCASLNFSSFLFFFSATVGAAAVARRHFPMACSCGAVFIFVAP